jgi:hypothetical protein
MQSSAKTPDEYYKSLPEDRKKAMTELRNQLRKNIPKGFQETMQYGMPGFSVPHSKYPAGYHCDPRQALPFLGVASQKNFIAVYHMGLYADPKLLKWFTSEYPKHSKRKLDMGKSCIRFRNPTEIPFDLIGQLATKMTPEDWIALYEKHIKR